MRVLWLVLLVTCETSICIVTVAAVGSLQSVHAMLLLLLLLLWRLHVQPKIGQRSMMMLLLLHSLPACAVLACHHR